MLRVAQNQRAIMLCILAQMGFSVVNFAVALPPIVLTLLSLVVGLASIYFTVALARVLYSVVGVVVSVVFLLVPFVGLVVPVNASILTLVALITLFVVNQRATKALKAGGFRVGLLGGDPSEVEARIKAEAP